MAQESVLRIVIDSKNAERNARAVAGELDNLTKKGDQAETQMTAMSASIKSLVGYMGGLLTINKAIAMADGYTQMAARIRNATASAEEYTLVQDRLLDTANGTYRALSEAQEVYLATSGGLKELGYSTKEALDISDSLSYSFVHNATSADKAKSAMDAYGKILDKGKVEADAWFSLMAAVPNILTDVANATGKSTAEIRKLGATGQLAARDLHQGFLLSRDSNNQLADAMENSLADGFMKLNNAVTVYLGKANETTSATGILADGLGVLAKNLDLVASAGAAVGLGYATTALLAKSAAVKQSLVDSAARRAADQVEMQSQVQLAAIEVQRARQITALAAQEIHLARQELNSATTRQARAAATMRLTQAEVALNIATKNTTTATAAYSAAQGAATATSLTLAGAARSALAFMTGPVGLGITVATVAAGYLLLGNNSEKSTASLRENNEAVGDAITKYRELNSVQQTNQLVVEKEKLEALEKEYTKISSTLMIYATNMGQANDFVTQSQIELEKLFKEYQKTGDLEKFTQAVQSSGVISQKTKDEVAKLASSVDQAGESAKKQKSFIVELGNNTQTAGNQASSAAAQYRDLAEAVSSVTKGLNQQVYDAAFVNKLEKMGKSSQSAERWLETYKKNAEQGVKGITAEQKVLLNSIDTIEKQAQARVEAQRKASQASNKAAKDSASEVKRQAKENERIAAEQYDAREQIAYRYADRNKKIETDLANEIKEIQEANFAKPEQTQGFIENAKRRAGIEKELYAAQLAEQLNEWQDTEEKKLDRKVLINELMIQLDADMHDDVKKQAMKSLVDQSNHELALIKLTKETRIFQANQAIYSEMELIQKRYELERRKIMEIQDLEERSALLAGSHINQAQDESALRDSTLSAYSNIMGYEESPLVQQFEVLQQMRELDLLNEEAYQNAKLELQAKSTAGYMEGMLGGFAALVDENSKTYAVLFGAQKAFAVAQATLNIPAAYSKAYDAVVGTPFVGPYIAPAVGAAAAALQVAQAASMKSVNMKGFATGGYTGHGAKYDPAGIVHKGEGVLTQEEIKALGGPQGFEDLRKSIRRGYATGGLVADTHRVGMGAMNAINNGGSIQAEKQAQANAKVQGGQTPNVNLNPNFVIVDEREKLGDYLFGPDGKKAFVKFFKQNKRELGFA